MNKFTIFTIILVVSVVTVAVDLAARDYLAKNGQANVMGEEISPVIANSDSSSENHESSDQNVEVEKPTPEIQIPPPVTSDSVANVVPQPSATVNQEKIKSAGFTGVLTEKHFNGKVYELLDITKIAVDAIGFYELVQDGGPIASITEIALKDEIRALQMYVLLQNKTKTYIDLSLNETNAYGDRSFYINHSKKPDEAFLTVKIGRMIYAFAYVKTYHPEVKKLIQLLAS